MTDVWATFQLPIHIWVTNEVLNTSIPTTIGGVVANVLTAVPTGMSDGTTAPALGPIPDTELNRAEEPWTTSFAAFLDVPSSAGIRRLGFHFSDSPSQPVGSVPRSDGTPEGSISTLVEEGLTIWFDSVCDWIEVLTGQDLNHRHPVFDASSIAPGYKVWRDGQWVDSGFRIAVPRVKSLTLVQWTMVLQRVGAGRLPPLEFLLHADARAAYKRDDFRRAVLDSATASEIVLGRLYRAVSPPLLAQGVKPAGRGLGAYTHWIADNDPSFAVGKGPVLELAKIRNNVIHAGAAPTKAQAYAGTEAAKEVVEAYGEAF